jgi:threonine dehydrogenase-like Zn-dependent dehydrogenase
VRALRTDGQNARLVADAPAPIPGPGEALVRVRRVGLTPADASAAGIGGVRRAVPFVGTLGHEVVGVVEEVNVPPDAPASLRARVALRGKRVVASPSILCGQCDMCRSGLSPHCRERRVLGLWGRDGTLAEHAAVPLASLVQVPDAMSDEQAVLAPQLASAVHLSHLVRTDAGAFVTILGDNLAALLAAIALSAVNKSARLVGVRPDRLALCDRWGLKHRPLEEAGRRQDQGVVIDCTGSAAGLRLALQFVRPRGTIVLTAPAGGALPVPRGVPFPEQPGSDWAAPVDLGVAVANEVHVLGSREGPVTDGVSFMLEHPVDAPALIARRFPLERAIDALQIGADPAGLKVVVDCV